VVSAEATAPADPEPLGALTEEVAGVMAGLAAGAEAPLESAEELVVPDDVPAPAVLPVSDEAGGGVEPEPLLSAGAGVVVAAAVGVFESDGEADAPGELDGPGGVGSAVPAEGGAGGLPSVAGAAGVGLGEVAVLGGDAAPL
jgi:hypothetical protein